MASEQMPPDLPGGAPACVRDIRRGIYSSASATSFKDPTFALSTPSIPISCCDSTPPPTGTIPILSSSASSCESDYTSSSSISSQSSIALASARPPAYSSLYPPSPPVMPFSWSARAPVTHSSDRKSDEAGHVMDEATLLALSRGVTRVGIGPQPLSPRSTTSSLSLVSEASTDSDDGHSDVASILSARPLDIAHDLASTIFPNLDLSASSSSSFRVSAIPVEVTSNGEEWAAWDGFVLDEVKPATDGEAETEVRTLYVRSKNYDGVNVRENVIALLELADETMECDGVVICLEKTNPDLSSILHSLLYVGGSIVHADPGQGVEGVHSPDYVLVGLDL